MNFGTDLPAPTSRFVELGLGKSGGYYFLPLDLNWSRQVSIAVMFERLGTSVGTYPQRLVHLARVQRRPLKAHGHCEVAKMYILMSTNSLENNKRFIGDH